VQELHGKRVGAGVIAIPQKSASVLEEALERLNIKHKRIGIWLDKDGVIKLNM